MPYDIVAHAKSLDSGSTGVCELAERFGEIRFAQLYQNLDPDEKLSFAIRFVAQSYIDNKRRFTLNLLEFPHKSATVTTSDPVARRVINRIGRNSPLPADKILQPLVAGDRRAFEEFGLLWSYLPDSEIHDIAWESFHGWYGTGGFAEAQFAARPLLSPVPVPVGLSVIIEEIRMCYAFGQIIAVHALCRSLLETALTDVCLRTGVFTAREATDDAFLRDFGAGRRIRRTFAGAAKTDASHLYCTLSRVLHGSAKPGETRSVIQATIGLVERLYEQNACRLQA